MSRRGAYVAYLGSGEHPVTVRVLGGSAIAPGSHGYVRLHLDQPVPLLPGDRYILREFGRSETVGGGEILDVAPVRPASKVRPAEWSGDVTDRVVAERGWITADELEAVTGERRPATVGPWVVAPGAVEAMVEALSARIAAAGPLGLDVAALDEREREVLGRVPDVHVADGRARPVAARDPLADHPFRLALEAAGPNPPPPDGVDRAELRELVRRNLVVERDGIYFAPSAVDTVAATAAGLLARQPDGFTVAELRDALGITRKHALPLANELDARGITRRRGDLRIAGPRLPAPPRLTALEPGPPPSSSSSSRGGLRRERPKSRRRAPVPSSAGFDRASISRDRRATCRSLVMTSTNRPGSASSQEWLPSTTVPAVPDRGAHRLEGLLGDDAVPAGPDHRDREAAPLQLLQLGSQVRPAGHVGHLHDRARAAHQVGERVLQDDGQHPRRLADGPDVRREVEAPVPQRPLGDRREHLAPLPGRAADGVHEHEGADDVGMVVGEPDPDAATEGVADERRPSPARRRPG